MIATSLCEYCGHEIHLYILKYDLMGMPLEEDGHPYWSGGGEWDYLESCFCVESRELDCG